jgi:hypothetical protein
MMANATAMAIIKPRNAHIVHPPRSRTGAFMFLGRPLGEEHAGNVETHGRIGVH